MVGPVGGHLISLGIRTQATIRIVVLVPQRIRGPRILVLQGRPSCYPRKFVCGTCRGGLPTHGSFLVLQGRPSCYPRESVCGTCLSGPPTFMAPFLFYKRGPAAIRESPSAVLASRALLLLWLPSCFTGRRPSCYSRKSVCGTCPSGPPTFMGPFLFYKEGQWAVGALGLGGKGRAHGGTVRLVHATVGVQGMLQGMDAVAFGRRESCLH